VKRVIYGYGIVDKDNKPFWDEACVCEDDGRLHDTVQDLNRAVERDDRAPYRVARLYIETNRE
jgi:hypothetical protein